VIGFRCSSSAGGRIINITSVFGQMGRLAGQLAASKAGLNRIDHAIAARLARATLLVTQSSPGFIETAMTSGFSDDFSRTH